ncbi:MAG: HIT family protein [Candidatus Nanoarchaeia archaeon]
MTSIFTKIINKEIPSAIIYEDEEYIAFLDIAPMERGHTLVVPKKEFETIFDMSEKEFLELQRVVFKIATHIQSTLNCGINICQNNYKIAGQDVPHVHFHIIPRREEKTIYNKDAHIQYEDGEMEEFKNRLELDRKD